MVSVGYFLSCEEFGPHELVRQARLAEQAGFGQSPFVWSAIGALSEVTSLPISTAVTCPTMRIHPAIVAQAAATATASVQCEGRFVLGVGTGEALNEHILGDRWPPSGVRRAMLREAVEVIRALHAGGEVTHGGGRHSRSRRSTARSTTHRTPSSDRSPDPARRTARSTVRPSSNRSTTRGST